MIEKELVHQLLRNNGLPDEEVIFIRKAENVLFKLNSLPIVIRVHNEKRSEVEVLKEINVATFLQQNNIPTTKLSNICGHNPFFISDRYITIWELVEHNPSNVFNWYEFGKVISKFHNISHKLSHKELKQYNLLTSTEKILNNIYHSKEYKNILYNRLSKLKEKTNQSELFKYQYIIHGDMHKGNVLVDNHSIYLSDYEFVSIGAKEWDLIPTYIAMKRFNLSESTYKLFCDGYGDDIREWKHIELATEIRELFMVTCLLQHIDKNNLLANEFNVRLQTLDSLSTKWSAF